MTGAANTIKGVLDQARTYAMANNTYTWVGFAGSLGASPSSVTGQVFIATVASNDGTQLGTDSTSTSPLVVGSTPGTVTQLGK